MKRDYTEYFKETVIRALVRYNTYEVYDLAGCYHDACVYAELKARLDFDRYFRKAEWELVGNKEVLKVYLVPRFDTKAFGLPVRQSHSYCKNTVSPLKNYIERYYKHVEFISSISIE